MKFKIYLISLVTLTAFCSVSQAQRVGPEEVGRDIAKLQNSIHQELTAQLTDLVIKIAGKPNCTRLHSELKVFVPEGAELTSIREFTHEQKQHIVQSLSIESREIIFNELSKRLLNGPAEPFKIPEGSTAISQLDTFWLLIGTLIDNDTRYTPLKEAMRSCCGVKVALTIKSRLSSERVASLIPQSFKDQFFTSNPAKILIMSQRIQSLASTYRK
jgi:hypothetical protein